MFIFGARNFHSRRTWKEKLASEWRRLMASVSGACVMGLRPKMSLMIMTDRAILREIQWLRLQQQASSSPCSSIDHASSCQMVPISQSAQQLAPGTATQSSQLVVDELRLLRRRRDELECRMVSLQSSRRQLMTQIDTLMTVLKVRTADNV